MGFTRYGPANQPSFGGIDRQSLQSPYEHYMQNYYSAGPGENEDGFGATFSNSFFSPDKPWRPLSQYYSTEEKLEDIQVITDAHENRLGYWGRPNPTAETEMLREEVERIKALVENMEKQVEALEAQYETYIVSLPRTDTSVDLSDRQLVLQRAREALARAEAHLLQLEANYIKKLHDKEGSLLYIRSSERGELGTSFANQNEGIIQGITNGSQEISNTTRRLFSGEIGNPTVASYGALHLPQPQLRPQPQPQPINLSNSMMIQALADKAHQLPPPLLNPNNVLLNHDNSSSNLIDVFKNMGLNINPSSNVSNISSKNLFESLLSSLEYITPQDKTSDTKNHISMKVNIEGDNEKPLMVSNDEDAGTTSTPIISTLVKIVQE